MLALLNAFACGLCLAGGVDAWDEDNKMAPLLFALSAVNGVLAVMSVA